MCIEYDLEWAGGQGKKAVRKYYFWFLTKALNFKNYSMRIH